MILRSHHILSLVQRQYLLIWTRELGSDCATTDQTNPSSMVWIPATVAEHTIQLIILELPADIVCCMQIRRTKDCLLPLGLRLQWRSRYLPKYFMRDRRWASANRLFMIFGL